MGNPDLLFIITTVDDFRYSAVIKGTKYLNRMDAVEKALKGFAEYVLKHNEVISGTKAAGKCAEEQGLYIDSDIVSITIEDLSDYLEII